MNKNLIYFFLLILLGGLTYYFVFRDKEADYPKEEANFTVKNIEDVSTVLLTDLEGNKIRLSKIGSEWMANDTIEVVESRVRDLLEALHEQQVLSPVRLGDHDEVIKQMSSGSYKVEVYEGKAKTHTFYVSKVMAPDNLTYMLTEGAKRPYLVKLPVQKIFLGPRYSTDINTWRSRKIMKAKAQEIEMIDISYKDSSQYSFHLIQEKGKDPVLTGIRTINKPVNMRRVRTYMNLWDSVYCLGYEEHNRIKDTIFTKGKELATIRLKKINKPEQILTLYFKPISKGTKAILKIGGVDYDFDVFIGLLNHQYLLTMNRKFAQNMLRSYPEFFETEQAPPAPTHS